MANGEVKIRDALRGLDISVWHPGEVSTHLSFATNDTHGTGGNIADGNNLGWGFRVYFLV